MGPPWNRTARYRPGNATDYLFSAWHTLPLLRIPMSPRLDYKGALPSLLEQPMRGFRQNSLRRVELAAWTLGTLLVATYAGAQWWYAHGRDQGIAAFDAARGEALRSPATATVGQDFAAGRVDMSTWSPQRVEHYRESARAAGVPLAVLRIPALKLAVPVFEGTSEQNLNRGAGRIAGTARIGEPGNVGIAAHRDGFFRVLKDVQVGDVLLLERLDATDSYRIVSTVIVDPSDVSVLEPTATHSVTLVTCFPFYYVGSAPRRFIVHAQLVSQKKTPAGEKSRQASRAVSR